MARSYYVISKRAVHATLFLTFLTMCTSISALWSSKRTTKGWSLKTQVHVNQDSLSKFLPADIQYAALTVEDSDRYGVSDDNDWSSLFPKGHGFIRLHSAEEPSGHAFYAISMYHQLHCLNGFRRLTVSASAGNVSQHNMDHAIHCLSYLRQLLLCHADTALEPARLADTTNGGQTQAVYGEGTTHICRDWSQIRAWAEQNYEEWKEDDIYEVSEGGSLVNASAHPSQNMQHKQGTHGSHNHDHLSHKEVASSK